jgi:hypothetical protein
MAKRTKHSVLIDAHDRGHVSGRRESLSRFGFALGDLATKLRSHLEVEGHGMVAVGGHGQIVLSVLVSFR